VVWDVNGRLAWRGDVDLQPTLRRVETAARFGYANDGGVFDDQKRQLPSRRLGYYLEYVIPTPGISHSGPQRLVVGAGGELYYTPNHYANIYQLR